jgi:hypothetical protein
MSKSPKSMKRNTRTLFSWALGLLLTLAGAAGSVAIAQQGTCGSGPGQLSCFDPYAAGEMWRSLTPILSRTTPDLDATGNPDPAKAEPDMTEDDEGNPIVSTNEFGDEIWTTITTSLTTAKQQIGANECTFSHLGDPLGSTRVCKAADGVTFVPPPIGKVFYPAGVAVYKHRVFVSDRMNHRVQVVNFYGQPLNIAKPIGNGEPGTGLYTTLYPGQAAAGSRLSAPNGLAVDGLGRLLVADGGNARVAIFDGNTGEVAFPTGLIHKTITRNTVISNGGDFPVVVPTAVAITPGATLIAPTNPPTVPPAGQENNRIAVIDRWKCSIKVYDVGFKELWQYPTVKPQGSPTGSACVATDFDNSVGVFSIMTGVAIDAAGHIYVVDSWNNRIQVFSRDGALLGAFGAPADPDNPSVDALATPSSVLIDHNGRVVVNDSDNLRIAFYDVTFPPAGAPQASFLFEVPAAGDDVEDYPTGLAEQWGTSSDGVDQYGKALDPAGRYLKVDTAGQRLQRLELADLAIVQASAKSGQGSFNVAVPTEKANPVLGTHVDVVPGELDEDGNIVNVPPNVAVTLIEDVSPGTPAADDIYPGQWVKYRFTYTDSNPTPLPTLSFVITAVGNETSAQPTEAPPVQVNVRGDCAECDAGLQFFWAANPSQSASTVSTVTGEWFSEKVLARLTPAGVDAARVKFIEWQVTGSDLAALGNGVHQSFLPPGARWVDVAFAGKSSDLTFWAVLDDNTVGPEHTQTIRVDRTAPTISFNVSTPASGIDPNVPGGMYWWKTDVSGTYAVTDSESGTDTPGGAFTITGSGIDLTSGQTAVDRVGHSATVYSNNIESGGMMVNIDRVGPVVTPPANLYLVAGVDGNATVPTSFVNGGTAVDALSGVNGAVAGTGPNTVASGQTVTWTFTATDYAGNSSQATATVTAAGSALIYTGPSIVEYGRDLAVSASLEPADATGQIRFTLVDPVRGDRVVLAPLAGGVASTVLPGVLANVGQYPMRVEYVGTAVPAAMVTSTVQVIPAPFSIDVTAGQGKAFGVADPASFSYHLPAQPYHPLDVMVGTLSRQPGEAVGAYLITLGTFNVPDGRPCQPACTSNYTIVLHSQPFTIGARIVNVKADDKIKLIGAVDPALTYTIEPPTSTTGLVNGAQITGALTRLPGEALGSYAIINGGSNPLTAGANYSINVVPGTLTIVSNLPGNTPPTAAADTASTTGAAPVDIDVLTNDSDPNGDALVIASVTQPASGGVVTITGNKVKFTPTPNFQGTATFTYTISDGRGGTATATVTVTVTGGTCLSGKILLSANDGATSGTAGNTRTFSGAGVKVKVTGWSRTKNNGAWSKAYLGAYGSYGLGVTDGSEGSGRDDKHKVDNIGERLNFVLFEFSQPVTVGRAFLDYIGADGDLTAWVGTRNDPFNNRLTLSDALLTGFGSPLSNGSSSRADRWAAFNPAGIKGNVLVIAADAFDQTPDDEFKIAQLELVCGAVNHEPVAANDTLTTAKNTAKTISVLANDRDEDDDDLTLASVTQPSRGSVTMNSNGTIKYTPPSNWVGTTSFTYTVSDGNGGSDTATVTVTVKSHSDSDDCDGDHDHNGRRDHEDDEERDCDRDHRHTRDCDHQHDGRHNDDCDRRHEGYSRCNDNNGWYNWNYRW